MARVNEKIRQLFNKYSLAEIRRMVTENEKYLSPGTLLFGFIIDSLTLTRADVWLDNLILLSYLALAGAAIMLINAEVSGKLENLRFRKVVLWFPFVLQFAFGGLFSGFIILYSRSASIITSWPFLLVLAFLLVGNEFFRNRYYRLAFQIGIYFVAILSYLTFAIPVLLDQIGPGIFLISTVMASALILIIINILRKIAPEIFKTHRPDVIRLIVIILTTFNLLYFANIIPPIPLALKEIIIAHDIGRSGNNYLISYEPPRWYHFFWSYDRTFHRANNKPVYAFSLVYAPTNIKTVITHEWSRYDEKFNKWMVLSRLNFSISGGREEGFHGYSYKTNLQDGKWRVAVKTATGQILGRTTFVVQTTESPSNIRIEMR